MAVRLVCRACGKRLKLPDGAERNRAAKCPKCRAPVDLTAAREASAYRPTVARRPPPLLGEDDPLPYPPPLPSSSPSSAAAPTGGLRPPLVEVGEVLSLDDDPPFRVPVRVLADSLRQVVGPCFAVFVPHGVFLEHEPLKPFLYVPAGCPAEAPAAGELTATLPDGRAVTLRFEARGARPLARDAVAFLAGARPVPVAADYRRKWWMLWPALIFALGLAGGPLVLSQTANLGLEFGLKVGAGFALLGLVANAAVVLLSRWPVPGQLAVMAGVCVPVTGVFLFGATAFLAGRQQAAEEAKPDPPTVTAPNPPVVPVVPVAVPPDPPPTRPPSHLDRAKKNGSSALDDGPADVTALALAPDGIALAIGHADGGTRIWPLDQPTFDPFLLGPKADGPVARVHFDAKSRFVFAHGPTGVVAAPKNGPPAVTARLPGAPVAVAPEPVGDRIRFAAVRGNTLQHRVIAEAFVLKPPVPKAKDKDKLYAFPGKGDEVIPINNAADPQRPGGGAAPTFLAWGTGGRLFAGQADGAIAIWSPTMKAEAASRDHKAPVKAWATCPATGDFATGDEQGSVGIWSAKGGKPAVTTVLSAPITGLSFNATGSRVAVTDKSGWLVIWDVAAAKAVHRVKRPTAIRAMAYGPTDDVILLAAGKTVEVWWLPELVK